MGGMLDEWKGTRVRRPKTKKPARSALSALCMFIVWRHLGATDNLALGNLEQGTWRKRQDFFIFARQHRGVGKVIGGFRGKVKSKFPPHPQRLRLHSPKIWSFWAGKSPRKR